ncbi:MAG: diguanylate cyclase [Eubacterium sp.]|nr:diguanylate cyclase [Eubacterium sp.]
MQRKRLAVVLSQADSSYQRKLLTGLLGEAFRYDFDVCVFTAFIKEGTPDEYQTGESNIYNLINPEKFDGAIIVPDTIKFTGITEKIISDFKKYNVPIVTADYQIDDLPCVWNSDIGDIEKLVDHLIDVHGCRVIDFFSGYKDHPHSINREAGYIRSLEKHGIPFEPERIHYGDFGIGKSEEVADAILNSGRPLPQAIACVGENSAESLIEVLKSRGCRVPEDFLITGYDTPAASPDRVGEITTMIRNSGYAGSEAIRCIYREIYGKEPEGITEYDNSEVITSDSCGCGISHKRIFNNHSVENESIYELLDSFYSGYTFMMEDLIAIDSYEEFFWNIDWYKRFINDIDGMYICACDDWQTIRDESETGYRTVGYSDKMVQVYTYEDGVPSVDTEKMIDRKLMLPRLYVQQDKPSVYYFTPWHFNDRCFGYTVLQYINKPIVFDNNYASWMRTADNAFEAMRRRMELKALYEQQERLKAFSVTDSLTGIYNRNGYYSMAVETFDSAKQEDKNVFVLVGDMNNLKTINDTYGHIEGDAGIKEVALAMKNACEKDEKCFRIGGDEFVLIGTGDYTDDEIKSKLQKVESHIRAFNNKSGKPYEISISLGYEYAPARNFDNIENAMSSADEKMFINKQEYKKMHEQ